MNLFNSISFPKSQMIFLLKSISSNLYQKNLDDSIGIGTEDGIHCKIYKMDNMYRFSIKFLSGNNFYDYNKDEKNCILNSLNLICKL